MGFAGILRQSTAVDVLIGPFVDSTDGDAEETGLTIAQADVRLSKNGQTAAQKNDNTTCAHDADGLYNCELDATDTNTVGQLTLYVHVAGALCVRHDFQVVEENVYDAWFAASAAAGTDLAAILVDTGTTLQGELDGIQADTEDIQSRLPAALVGGRIDANAGAISGDATAADNLEAALDGTGGVTITAAVTGNITGNLSGSVGSVTGAVGSVAAGGISAASLAADTITAAKVAADVSAEIADAVWEEDLTDHSGTADSTAEALAGASAPTAGEVADAVWDEARADHTTNGSFGQGAASVQGNVTGNVTGNVGGNVTGSVGSLAAQAKADVNAEVVDALATDTYAEPGQGTPAATTTLAAKLGYLYKFLRNRVTVSADTISVYNDDATTVGQKSTHADDGTTYDRGEFTTGA